MIEIGKEYIFNYRVEMAGASEEDIEVCVHNSGLNCKVIEVRDTDKYGHMYEVESCNGSEFFAYESELDELKENDVRWWYQEDEPAEKIDWFKEIAARLRDYYEGNIWSSGVEILCKTEEVADALADMFECLYRTQGEEVLVNTGYYDPAEDERNGETDRYTGWWYVNIG